MATDDKDFSKNSERAAWIEPPADQSPTRRSLKSPEPKRTKGVIEVYKLPEREFKKAPKIAKRDQNVPILSSMAEESAEIARLSAELTRAFNKFCHSEQDKINFVRRIVDAAKPTHEKQALPTVAPALWKDRPSRKSDNPAEFIRKNYSEWIGQGLTRALIRQLDPPLYNAFAAHIRNHGEPGDLDLPSRSVLVDRELAQLGTATVRSVARVIEADRTRQRRASRSPG